MYPPHWCINHMNVATTCIAYKCIHHMNVSTKCIHQCVRTRPAHVLCTNVSTTWITACPVPTLWNKWPNKAKGWVGIPTTPSMPEMCLSNWPIIIGTKVSNVCQRIFSEVDTDCKFLSVFWSWSALPLIQQGTIKHSRSTIKHFVVDIQQFCQAIYDDALWQWYNNFSV